jgi:RNA polymerase sigma-70 factor (ECF subfamily)
MRAPRAVETCLQILQPTPQIVAEGEIMIWSHQEATKYHDVDLVELARHGCDEAFGELVRRHWGKCLKVAASYLRNATDAEDQAQNACLKAYEHLDQYQGEAEFATWLARIVANQCLMSLRTGRRIRFLYLDDATTEQRFVPIQLTQQTPDPENELEESEMRLVVQNEIRRMPPLLRKVILLRDIDGLPMNDVAGRLGITISAAKSRLVRARMELRSRMIRHCPEEAFAHQATA